MKPVALVADAMRDCSRRGDIVLDPFMGSGTTILAAERVGRRAYGLELDPALCRCRGTPLARFHQARRGSEGIRPDLRRGGGCSRLCQTAEAQMSKNREPPEACACRGNGPRQLRGRLWPAAQGASVQAGQSGNPKGRPKGAKNEATILRDILNQQIEIREGGRVTQGQRARRRCS